ASRHVVYWRRVARCGRNRSSYTQR
ncbi:MAG: hypothetical protein ACOYXT_12230, partial [Bacteroidota bacterium]